MTTSKKTSTLLSTAHCLMIIICAFQSSFAYGSLSLGNPNESERSMNVNSVASKPSSLSDPSVDTMANNHDEVVSVGLSDALSSGHSSAVERSREKRESSVPELSERQASKLDHRVRAKRTWKNNRVQAAWGKRSNDARPTDATKWRRIKVSDTRLRRKWSQVGRQAWGKRDYAPGALDELVLEPELTKNDYNLDDSLVRNRRKWGVGSAKAAWGKRNAGELGDGNVKNDDRAEAFSGRSKRSVVGGSRLEDQWNSYRMPADLLLSKRFRRSLTGSLGRSLYDENSRRWELMGKASDQYLGSPADSALIDYEGHEDSNAADDADSPYSWSEAESGKNRR